MKRRSSDKNKLEPKHVQSGVSSGFFLSSFSSRDQSYGNGLTRGIRYFGLQRKVDKDDDVSVPMLQPDKADAFSPVDTKPLTGQSVDLFDFVASKRSRQTEKQKSLQQVGGGEEAQRRKTKPQEDAYKILQSAQDRPLGSKCGQWSGELSITAF